MDAFCKSQKTFDFISSEWKYNIPFLQVWIQFQHCLIILNWTKIFRLHRFARSTISLADEFLAAPANIFAYKYTLSSSKWLSLSSIQDVYKKKSNNDLKKTFKMLTFTVHNFVEG